MKASIYKVEYIKVTGRIRYAFVRIRRRRGGRILFTSETYKNISYAIRLAKETAAIYETKVIFIDS